MAGIDSSAFVLSEDEEILRSWTYATESKGNENHQLVVTNKRIVSIDSSLYSNGKKTNRLELRTKNISSVYCSSGIQSFISAGIICIILAVLGLIGTIILAIMPSIIAVVPAIVMLITTILAIHFFRNKNVMLQLVIYINSRNEEAFSMGASMGLSLKSKHKGKVKIKIDALVAEDIVTTIGALLLAND